MSHVPYVYEALPSQQHIRLINLHPGTGSDPLYITLVPATLDNLPDYEALSYVWGEEATTSTHSIICNAVAVAVTQNLDAALRQFRHADTSRTLWADALCINQRDLDERAQQVQIMHHIYKSCTQCLVWLGPGDVHSHVALDIIRDITGIVSKTLSVPEDGLDHHLKVEGRDPHLAFNMGFTGLPPPDSTEWGSLFHFLCRPWFSRVWVIQEIYFASTVLFYCGPRTLTYASLFHASSWVLDNGGLVSFEAIQSMAQYMTLTRFNIMRMRPSDWQRDHQQLKNLLDGVKRFDAKDPRDKMYALIHFPPFRREYPDIQVDYRMSCRDLYTDVTRRIIQYEKGLGVLSIVDHGRGGEDMVEALDGQLPSWVPSWHRQDHNPNASSMWHYFFSAGTVAGVPSSPVLSASADHGDGGEVLGVTGFELDVIQDVCFIDFEPTRVQVLLLQPIFRVSEPWEPYRYSPESPYPTPAHVLAAYAMTLTAMLRSAGGIVTRRCPEDEYRHQEADFVAWLQRLRTHRGEVGESDHGGRCPPGLDSQELPLSEDDLSDADKLESATRYSMALAKYILQRRLFRTKGGYLGLGSHGLAKGDQVCILAGGALPIILRPRSTGDGGHDLVGDAYVHGVMDGEAAVRYMSQGQAWSSFQIH